MKQRARLETQACQNTGPSKTRVVVFVPILHGRTTVTLRHYTSSAPYLIVDHHDQGTQMPTSFLMSGRSEYDMLGRRALLSNRLASMYSRAHRGVGTGTPITTAELRIRPAHRDVASYFGVCMALHIGLTILTFQ
jgi:hypothetical protein